MTLPRGFPKDAAEGATGVSSDILSDLMGALSEGLAVFDENALLVRCNERFKAMNPTIADLLEVGFQWDILLREWVLRQGLPAVIGERLAFMEQQIVEDERVATPLEVEVGDRTYEIALRTTATGGMVLVQTDISQRVAAEQNERDADQLVRKVLESCPANIIMSRVGDGEIIYRTPAATELLGKSRRTGDHFASRGERADFITALLPDGRVDDMAVTGIRADGSRFPSLVSARLIHYRGEDVVVSTTVDATKEVELRRRLADQREQIFQAEKMSALGELLAGVAHELNNPLSVVVGHALMLHDEDIDPDTQRRVTKISEAAERCAKIVKSFLAMARQHPTRLVPFDIAETMSTALDALAGSAEGVQATVESDFAADLPKVRGDAHQIAQVIINLVTNADQAISESGTGDKIRVSLRHDAASEQVVLSVADNGPGVPDKIKTRIFDPLFTTKPVGSGTGIGLALCHRIVTAHSGRIAVAPNKGDGAEFLVYLPTTREGADETAGKDEEAGNGSRGRVLVVDDEEDVAELVCEILERDGFSVTTSNSGEEGLELALTGDFALILSDLNMPGLDGRGVYERILKDRPDLARRIGFVTGDTMSPQARGFLDGIGSPYLEKPIAPGELRKLAHGILGEGQQTG